MDKNESCSTSKAMAPRRPSKVLEKSDSPPNETVLKLIKCVQTIYAKQHFQQLRLDFGINCFDPYSKIFLENVNVREVDFRKKKEASVLLKEHRIDIFLHMLNKLVSTNQFVGTSLIQSILEFILTINQKYDETADTTSRRLQTASLLFEKVLDNFPPSWPACSSSYKNLLYSPISIDIDFKKIRMNSSNGLFPIILALLDDVFKETDNGDGTGAAFDSMMNFQQYERVENAKCSYSELSRNEKIDRLFIVMNLLVKLMEIDLWIWIQRYPFQTKTFMSNPHTCPLIAHLLWKGKGKDCGEVNGLMREILKVFTTSMWIKFPDDKTDILARLVHLMSVAVNLSENSDSNNLISYPNIKRLTESFASEMGKSIESFPYTIDFCINVISKIRSPVVSMLISTRILTKFSKEYENITLRKIVNNISNDSYMQYLPRKVDDGPNQCCEKYPTYDPKKDKKPSKLLAMNRDEYLTLVLHLFKSYVEVYRTHDVKALWLADANAVPNNAEYSDQVFMIAHQKVENEKNHRMDFGQIFKDWTQLKAAVKDTAATDMMPSLSSVECQNVFLEAAAFVRLQEDLHYLLKLRELVDQNVRLGDLFKKWRSAVNEYVPK